MASWTTIASGDILPDKPATAPQGIALYENPIAIAENDASVPVELVSYRLLATIPTTSGTTWVATSLVLTGFNFLLIYVNGLRVSLGSNESITLDAGGGAFSFGTSSINSSTPAWNFSMFSLDSGMRPNTSAEGSPNPQDSGLRRTTTSISFKVGPGRTGIGGSIKIYGMK